MINEILKLGQQDRDPGILINQRADGTPLRDLFMPEGILVADHNLVEEAKDKLAIAIQNATPEELESLKTLPENDARELAQQLISRKEAA